MNAPLHVQLTTHSFKIKNWISGSFNIPATTPKSFVLTTNLTIPSKSSFRIRNHPNHHVIHRQVRCGHWRYRWLEGPATCPSFVAWTMCVDWSIPSKFCAFSKIKERSGAGYDWSRQIGCSTSMYTRQPCRLARASMMHHRRRAGLFSHRLLCLCVGGNTTYTYVFRDAAQDFFLPNEYDEEAAVAHPPRMTSMMLHFCTTIQGRANECITPWWVDVVPPLLLLLCRKQQKLQRTFRANWNHRSRPCSHHGVIISARVVPSIRTKVQSDIQCHFSKLQAQVFSRIPHHPPVGHHSLNHNLIRAKVN